MIEELTAELTYSCQLDCIHCGSKGVCDTLNPDIFGKIIQEHNPKTVRLSGGEPTSVTLGNYMNKIPKSMKIKITTNGYNPNEIIKWKSRIKQARISVYGDEYQHEYITRKKGSFRKAIDCFNLLKKEGMEVMLTSPIFDDRSTFKLALVAHDLDTEVRVCRLIRHGNGKNILIMPREDQKVVCQFANRRVDNVLAIQGSLTGSCIWNKKLTLLPNGRLAYCTAGKWDKEQGKLICDRVCARFAK